MAVEIPPERIVQYVQAEAVAKRLVARLRELREQRGLTQRQLAVQAGMDVSVWAALEAGIRANLKLADALRVAAVLEVDLSQLLTEEA